MTRKWLVILVIVFVPELGLVLLYIVGGFPPFTTKWGPPKKSDHSHLIVLHSIHTVDGSEILYHLGCIKPCR